MDILFKTIIRNFDHLFGKIVDATLFVRSKIQNIQNTFPDFL